MEKHKFIIIGLYSTGPGHGFHALGEVGVHSSARPMPFCSRGLFAGNSDRVDVKSERG